MVVLKCALIVGKTLVKTERVGTKSGDLAQQITNPRYRDRTAGVRSRETSHSGVLFSDCKLKLLVLSNYFLTFVSEFRWLSIVMVTKSGDFEQRG